MYSRLKIINFLTLEILCHWHCDACVHTVVVQNINVNTDKFSLEVLSKLNVTETSVRKCEMMKVCFPVIVTNGVFQVVERKSQLSGS